MADKDKADELMVEGPRIRRRWVDLLIDDPVAGYEGFKIKFWVNAPTKLWRQLNSPDIDEALEAGAVLFSEHNGWMDEDGDILPQPDDTNFWERLPQELTNALMTAASLEINKLPNSMIPRNKKSRRG